jgi:multidrug resistance efflux pump
MASALVEKLGPTWSALRARAGSVLAHAPRVLRRHPQRWLAALGVLLALGLALRIARPPVDRALTVVVRRGELVAQVSAAGILRPASSITYRSPLAGREAEITQLAPEGVLVNEGDLVARLDTTELEADLLRAVQDARQAEVELRMVEVEREDVLGQIDSLKEGEGALGIAETQAALKRSERNVERLRQEYEGLKPLLDKGFVTRDEFQRSAAELEQAEAELTLARRKAEVQISRTRPREEQRARLQLAQKEAQIENSRARVRETAGRVAMLRQALEGCSMYARAGGLVVYEDFLGANPRRKVRVGDRVTASQGLVTIPEVQRMVVEASVPEGEVHRVAAGQPAAVRLDAFPGLVLAGRVSRVGTLARSSVERPWEAKRFDLIVDLDATTAALRPEMTARADVRVGELKDVLLLPVNAVFEQQGSFVCHVVRLLGVETRLVSLGESNDELVVVREGLSEGDRVSLTELPFSAPAPAANVAAPGGQMKMGGGAGRPQLAPR